MKLPLYTLILFSLSVGLLFIPLQTPSVSTDILLPPSSMHWLGTTSLGEDMVRLLLVGLLPTVCVSLAAGLLTTSMGIGAGYLTVSIGHKGRAAVLMGTDILLAVPEIAVLLLLATFLRPGPIALIAILAATSWTGEVRIFGNAIRSEMVRDSIHAARMFGGGRWYIFSRHILPAIGPLCAARTVAATRRAALKHAGLAFLGFVNPLPPTWGGIIQSAYDYLHMDAWAWLVLPPVICLSLYLLLVFTVGETLSRKGNLR